jgi:hypothetical protein
MTSPCVGWEGSALPRFQFSNDRQLLLAFGEQTLNGRTAFCAHTSLSMAP